MFSEVNTFTTLYVYTLLKITELVNKILKYKTYSTVYLKSSDHQDSISEKTKFIMLLKQMANYIDSAEYHLDYCYMTERDLF